MTNEDRETIKNRIVELLKKANKKAEIREKIRSHPKIKKIIDNLLDQAKNDIDYCKKLLYELEKIIDELIDELIEKHIRELKYKIINELESKGLIRSKKQSEDCDSGGGNSGCGNPRTPNSRSLDTEDSNTRSHSRKKRP